MQRPHPGVPPPPGPRPRCLRGRRPLRLLPAGRERAPAALHARAPGAPAQSPRPPCRAASRRRRAPRDLQRRRPAAHSGLCGATRARRPLQRLQASRAAHGRGHPLPRGRRALRRPRTRTWTRRAPAPRSAVPPAAACRSAPSSRLMTPARGTGRSRRGSRAASSASARKRRSRRRRSAAAPPRGSRRGGGPPRPGAAGPRSAASPPHPRASGCW
mmetsp:Transcript_30934/g.91978  ORF Transcript_30934/g.91978 Transcript_30934/m.91978 type:complete len:215 (+) Transcript_30934:1110-1754(+)